MAAGSVYVARQPILDVANQAVGYELLYRLKEADLACSTASDVASARVIGDALVSIGIERLTGGRLAFLNVGRALLVSDSLTLLDPSHTIFEILEDTPADREVLEACRRLVRAGYTLALDDFVWSADTEALLPYVRFIKVDVLQTPAEERASLVQRLAKYPVRLVAEKVETGEMLARTRAEGYQLFQGFYFCRPETIAGRAITGPQIAYMRLLSALARPTLSMGELEDLVKHDASLSHRVLQLVNSAAFGLRAQVRALREALVLLGLDTIRKWTLVWSLAAINTAPSETVTVAVVRARCCELLGRSSLAGADDLFLLGLCSLLDTMLGLPMAEAIADLPLSASLTDALLERDGAGTLRSVLDAVIAFEHGKWNEAAETLGAQGVMPDLLPNAYRDAMEWSTELLK